MEHILEVKELKTYFYTDGGEVPAVDNISFHVKKGEILGIVGESGCGKSVTSLSVMGLVPNPPGKIVGGSILFNGEELLHASEKRMREIRGNRIGMIFQEPMTSLNPVFTIGNQLIEAIRIHKKISKKQAKEHAIKTLKQVGLPRAETLINEYPHQLSGGMRQRVVIAMAIVCNPDFIIADEPTTALDVTIQAQILELIKDLNTKLQTAVMLITHDLGVVAEQCDRVIVMYAGQIVEQGDVETIIHHSKHPYTEGLIASVPDLNKSDQKLFSIPGQVPKPGTVKKGCPFGERCIYSFDKCFEEMPQLLEVEEKHLVRCWKYQ